MRWLRQGLRAIVMAILLLLCAALFYILVIMGDAPRVGTGTMPAVTQAAQAAWQYCG